MSVSCNVYACEHCIDSECTDTDSIYIYDMTSVLEVACSYITFDDDDDNVE